MENAARKLDNDRPNVPGWGVDLARENRPGVPREANDENVLSATMPRLTKQPQTVKLFLTKERAEMTPVFGTTVPPKGLSGLMRSLAFRYSENVMRHWLFLLFADRVGMMEMWLADLARGKTPMVLPRMEFRTLDHARRAVQQGPKHRDDYVALALVGLGCAGTGALLYWGAKKAFGGRRAA